MQDKDPSFGQSSASSAKQVKKPKLSISKKVSKRQKTSKKLDFIDTDDDFVSENPGPSTSNHQVSIKPNELSEQDIKRKKNRERQAKFQAKQSAAKREQRKTREALRQKTKRAAETKEEHQKRIKDQAKRQATMREAESAEEHQARIQLQAVRQSTMREAETAEEHQARIQLQAVRQSTKREAETTEEHHDRLQLQAERQAALRMAETDEEHQHRLRVQAATRANQPPQRQQLERSKARERMEASRNYTSAEFKDATRTQDILQGLFKVKKLEDTTDAIGKMTVKCDFCEALKFPKEKSRTTTCCSEGKINLTPFPKPPEALMNLWMGNDAKSRLFKAYARQLNNAVCLSSLTVTERNLGGFNPSVVFQGKVHHRAGALLPADGEQPKCAQLYVYDSAMESTFR